MKAAIFTEGSAEYGLGHIHRCIGFAQHLVSRGFAVDWVLVGDDLADRALRENGITAERIAGWSPRSVTCQRGEMDLAILDSYHAPVSCYEELARISPRRLWIDDTARLDYPEGHVLNTNPLVDQISPRTGKDGRWLLSGYTYQPLRRDFAERFDRIIPESPRKILVSIGGTDLRGITPMAIAASTRVLPGAAVDVVVPRIDQRSTWNHPCPDCVVIHPSRSAREMRQLMEDADLAICAGGQTLLECLTLGLPTIVIGVAENQRLQIEALRRSDAIGIAGWYDSPSLSDSIESALLQNMSRRRRTEFALRGPEIVDGKGCERCISAVLSGRTELLLRAARLDDMDAVWRISNTPDVRRQSLDADPIPWTDHVAWFRDLLRRESSLFFIVSSGDEPVGQLRYLQEGMYATVSVSLLGHVRGKGEGSRIIREGDLRAFATWASLEVIRAVISSDNIASIRAFENAGYQYVETMAQSTDRQFLVFGKRRTGEEQR